MATTLLLVLLLTMPTSFGARILGLMFIASRSHYLSNRQFLMELANRGHQVTVVTPDQDASIDPNFRHIHLEGVYEGIYGTFNYEVMPDYSLLDNIKMCFVWGQSNCKFVLQSRGFQNLLDLAKNETFDLIIAETTMVECYLSVVPAFGYPPVVGISLFESPSWISEYMGNPLNPSFIPAFTVSYSDHMTFKERIINLFTSVFVSLYRRFYHMPAQQDIVKKFVDQNIPNLHDLERNISLNLINIDQRLDYPRPLIPGMVPIAGMHIAKPKPLPQDIQEFLDNSEDGVIYFSLGSNVRSDKMHAERVAAFVAAFQELPQRVLWKWESDSLPGKPSNVMVKKWIPQNDVLAHPNVRVFITHSGLLSMQEAQHHGVPTIGVPFFADQKANIRRSVLRGTGVELNFKDVTKEYVLQVLNQVLKNDSYKENAKQWSSVFRDRPMGPMETAVFWVEYVLRHKGAKHLRSGALDLVWYQYFLLEVILVLLAVVSSVLIVLYLVVKKVCSCLTGSRTIKKKIH